MVVLVRLAPRPSSALSPLSSLPPTGAAAESGRKRPRLRRMEGARAVAMLEEENDGEEGTGSVAAVLLEACLGIIVVGKALGRYGLTYLRTTPWRVAEWQYCCWWCPGSRKISRKATPKYFPFLV